MPSTPELYLVIHLPPTPGSPAYALAGAPDPGESVERALREARLAEEAGYDGVIIENYGDAPYYPRAHPGAIALVAVAAWVVSRETGLRVGLSLLRNSPREAVEAAAASGASFVRINALCAPRLAPEGVIGPGLWEAAEALSRVGGRRVEVLADVDVKHGLPLSPYYTLEWEVAECAHRRGPLPLMGVAVTGPRTGEPPGLDYLERASKAARRHGLRVYLASGATPELVERARGLIDGVVVGSYVRVGGRAGAPLSPERLQRLARALKG